MSPLRRRCPQSQCAYVADRLAKKSISYCFLRAFQTCSHQPRIRCVSIKNATVGVSDAHNACSREFRKNLAMAIFALRAPH